MKWRKKVVGLVFIATIFSLISAPHLHAQSPTQGLSLEISPLPISLAGKPGTSVSTDLRVRNAGSQEETLKVNLLKVTEDNSGAVHLTQPRPSDEWAHWVSFSTPTFKAPSNEWQTVHMTINMPTTAAFGYYFAVEYTRAAQEAPQPGKAVTNGAVATFILLNAEAPGEVRQARIDSFTADRKSYEFLPANFSVKVHSSGNVAVAPMGNIFILRGSKQVDSIPVNAAGGNVLPGGSRFFGASWNNGFPVYAPKQSNGQPVLKNGQAIQSLKWDFSKANRLRFGHYTAHLVLSYDNGQRDVPLDAYVSFWIIPWRVVGAVVALVVLIAALITYIIILRRRLKKANHLRSRRV